MSLLVDSRQLNISDEQAVKYARSIYGDIARYVADHENEFEVWLKAKKESENN